MTTSPGVPNILTYTRVHIKLSAKIAFTLSHITPYTFKKEIDNCLFTRAQHWEHQHDVGAHAVREASTKPRAGGEDAGGDDTEPEIVVLDVQRCHSVNGREEQTQSKPRKTALQLTHRRAAAHPRQSPTETL